MSLLLDDLVVEIDGVLDRKTCQEIIQKFESDSRVHQGASGAGRGGDKISTDLLITGYSDWTEYDAAFFKALSPHVTTYATNLVNYFGNSCIDLSLGFTDSGYQIQRTTTNGKYDWHSDDGYFCIESCLTENPHPEIGAHMTFYERRLFTYIFYLNDSFEFEGGNTEFALGNYIKSVVPSAGKLLLFPANLLFQHRGTLVTSGSKYLATGWVNDYKIMNTKPTARLNNSYLRETMESRGHVLRYPETGY